MTERFIVKTFAGMADTVIIIDTAGQVPDLYAYRSLTDPGIQEIDKVVKILNVMQPLLDTRNT